MWKAIVQTVPAASDAPAAEPVDAETAPKPKGNILKTIALLPLRIVLSVLIVFDFPFSKLSARVKSLIGFAGVATSIVAVVTWVIQARRPS